ncbi:MAG: Dabb family protein [Acidobacteriota bacterium]|nr:MAG: Dabb family protein [Acidobacteriota bacterium]
MLIHIVCWKYKPETTPEMRTKHIESLRALSDIVAGIESLDVGADILGLDRSFDTGLVIKFTGRDALENYTIHPEHQKVAAMGREIAERAVSVDFET